MQGLQLKKEGRELRCAKWLGRSGLPKVYFDPRAALTEGVVPIEISDRDRSRMGHAASVGKQREIDNQLRLTSSSASIAEPVSGITERTGSSLGKRTEIRDQRPGV